MPDLDQRMQRAEERLKAVEGAQSETNRAVEAIRDQLSGALERVNGRIDEMTAAFAQAATKGDIAGIRGDVSEVKADVRHISAGMMENMRAALATVPAKQAAIWTVVMAVVMIASLTVSLVHP